MWLVENTKRKVIDGVVYLSTLSDKCHHSLNPRMSRRNFKTLLINSIKEGNINLLKANRAGIYLVSEDIPELDIYNATPEIISFILEKIPCLSSKLDIYNLGYLMIRKYPELAYSIIKKMLDESPGYKSEPMIFLEICNCGHLELLKLFLLKAKDRIDKAKLKAGLIDIVYHNWHSCFTLMVEKTGILSECYADNEFLGTLLKTSISKGYLNLTKDILNGLENLPIKDYILHSGIYHNARFLKKCIKYLDIIMITAITWGDIPMVKLILGIPEYKKINRDILDYAMIQDREDIVKILIYHDKMVSIYSGIPPGISKNQMMGYYYEILLGDLSMDSIKYIFKNNLVEHLIKRILKRGRNYDSREYHHIIRYTIKYKNLDCIKALFKINNWNITETLVCEIIKNNFAAALKCIPKNLSKIITSYYLSNMLKHNEKLTCSLIKNNNIYLNDYQVHDILENNHMEALKTIAKYRKDYSPGRSVIKAIVESPDAKKIFEVVARYWPVIISKIYPDGYIIN
ncbi:MAG: hypothetical protein ACOCRK_03750 [bacterium]